MTVFHLYVEKLGVQTHIHEYIRYLFRYVLERGARIHENAHNLAQMGANMSLPVRGGGLNLSQKWSDVVLTSHNSEID